MRGSRYSEEVVVAAVARIQAGEDIQSLSRELGVTQQTLYRWKWKYGGFVKSEAHQVMQLERQLHSLRSELRRLSLENQALKSLLQKN